MYIASVRQPVNAPPTPTPSKKPTAEVAILDRIRYVLFTAVVKFFAASSVAMIPPIT